MSASREREGGREGEYRSLKLRENIEKEREKEREGETEREREREAR